MRVPATGPCPRVERTTRGWAMPVTAEPDGYGTTGPVRTLVLLQVPMSASREAAQAEAERVWRSMGTGA